ncbi:MAG: recombination protein NinG [Acetobacter sp.]|nr:recombination protein NinG [Acetobacter sp.]
MQNTKKLTIAEKKKLRKEFITRMDKMTSLVVRCRDSKCASCGKNIPFKERQNGHFIGRAFLPTRFDLVNCNVECCSCNVYSPDHLVGYSAYILKHYGKKEFDRLTKLHNDYKNGKVKNSIPIDEALYLYRNMWRLTRQMILTRNVKDFPASWADYSKYEALDYI